MITITQKNTETGVKISIPVNSTTSASHTEQNTVKVFNDGRCVFEMKDDCREFSEMLFNDIVKSIHTSDTIEIKLFTTQEKFKRTAEQEKLAEDAMNE